MLKAKEKVKRGEWTAKYAADVLAMKILITGVDYHENKSYKWLKRRAEKEGK